MSDDVVRRRARADRALVRLWRTGLAKPPPLCASAIAAKALKRSALPSPAFPPGWEARLAHLCGELEASAGLSPLGRTIAHGQLVGAATAMLRMARLWELCPQIGDVVIDRPVIIAGQMRSGTTRIQRLLACDARFRHTRFYESWVPLPTGRARGLFDDRPWRARLALTAAHLFNPGFRHHHPTHAYAPDEEIGLFNLLMMPAAFEVQWRIPRFVRRCEASDTVPVYRLFRRMLQTLAWLRGKRDDRPWILKVPQFSEDLASLLAVFPDARIVRTERCADDIIASTVRLVENQMALQSADVDRAWIEREWRRKLALRKARSAAALANHSAPRTTVSYDAVDRDWKGAAAGIYRMLEMPLTENAAAAMAAFQAAHPTSRGACSFALRGAAMPPGPRDIAALDTT